MHRIGPRKIIGLPQRPRWARPIRSIVRLPKKWVLSATSAATHNFWIRDENPFQWELDQVLSKTPRWRALGQEHVDVSATIESALRKAGLMVAASDVALQEASADRRPLKIALGEFEPLAGDVTGTFVSGKLRTQWGERAYMLFTPAGKAAPLPLIVMLHGCTQDARDFAMETQMNHIAQQIGALVLYPEQSVGSNASKCWNWFRGSDQHREMEEPA